jgi:hypothetical protein
VIINPLRIVIAITGVAIMVIVTKQMSEALKNIRLSRPREVSVDH